MIEFKKTNFSESWLYEFECVDQLLIDEVLNDIKNIKFVSNGEDGSNSSSETSDFFHNNLFNWFEKCIAAARDDLEIPKTIDLPITICWANKTTKIQKHRVHNHNNSFMSGIFYLTDGHNGGETIFVCKNTWFSNYDSIVWPNKKTYIDVKYSPKKGTLLLFPSHILHKVSTVKDNNVRYTIAFNTFFSGNIDDSDIYKTKLSITPRTVRNAKNET